MRAEELQIGDWVSYIKMSPHKCSWQTLVNMEKNKTLRSLIQPIPITPEILEKSGIHRLNLAVEVLDRLLFEFESDDVRIKIIVYNYKNGNENWEFQIFNSNPYSNMATQGSFKYVHELQHALRLCHIDKEILL